MSKVNSKPSKLVVITNILVYRTRILLFRASRQTFLPCTREKQSFERFFVSARTLNFETRTRRTIGIRNLAENRKTPDLGEVSLSLSLSIHPRPQLYTLNPPYKYHASLGRFPKDWLAVSFVGIAHRFASIYQGMKPSPIPYRTIRHHPRSL